MPSESHKHSKGQAEVYEGIAATNRAIDTQVPSEYSFSELMKELNK